MRNSSRVFVFTALLATASAATACSSDATGPSLPPNGSGSAAAVRAVDSALGAGGTTRLEIELYPGELVAREVHVESDDAEEKLVSPVTAIDAAGGTLTLELGGLVVGYGDGTRFRTETEGHESRATWESRVAAAIAAGGRPLIEARRNPAPSPQAPDDASFAAADLRLAEGSDEPSIEIYVDQDNLVTVDGTASATLQVLGLAIALNGRSRLGPDDNGGPGTPAGTTEFAMAVSTVDTGAGTLTLASGTVIRVTSATVVSAEGDLFTLASAADAVAAGRPVRAEGRGTVETSGPPVVIVAGSLKIEVDD